MPKRQRVFYAFPGEPPALDETITNAINILKSSSDIKRAAIRFYPWTTINVAGKNLIKTILGEIDRADVFACDLTYPNPNVSFELGYAIGSFKRVWISLDTSVEDATQNYRRTFFALTTSGYAEYNNSDDLASAFLEDRPFDNPKQTLLGEFYRRTGPRQETPTLLYVRPPLDTESVNATTTLLSSSFFQQSIKLDDPNENPSPTLDWYASNLTEADAVLLHLLAPDQKGSLDHNVKCSLVAGLAKGFRKSMLMVAKTPFESPIDYQDLLQRHDTAAECKTSIGKWIDSLSGQLEKRRPRRPINQPVSSKQLDLRGLSVGEPVAENERQRLDAYFLETSTYYRALDDEVTIVVGRKGVGKSAQLYAMSEALMSDKRNHVCIVKPVGYELDGLVRVLQSIVDRSERGYLIESLWKFLLLSELARSVCHSLSDRPLHQEPNDAEKRLLEHYENHKDLYEPPFSERLDIAIRSLADVGKIEDSIEQRQRTSELLHSNQLRQLRDHLGAALTARTKVGILIDNLDSQWGTTGDIEHLAYLLWGLLEVSGDIVSQLKIENYRRKAVNASLTIFLRSDIFALIQPTALEQDKLPIQRIVWDDEEVLKRLVDMRLQFGVNNTETGDVVWQRFFPAEMVGIGTWDFVTNTVLPRPRDVIYLLAQAIATAINRGHSTVTEEDLLDAREKYSEYAFRSVVAEDDPRKGRLEAILYEFAGCPKIITRAEIEDRFLAVEVAASDVDFYIDLLCDVNFLAIESKDGYQYARDEADREVKRRIAKQRAKQRENGESYEVAAAFWQVLGIE